MHEFSLMANLMHKIDSIARVNHTQKVLGVKVKLGALSHISVDHFREHFLDAARGTAAQNARLNIEMLTDTDDPHAQEIILDSIELEG